MAEEPRVTTVKLMKHRRITIPKAIEEALRLKEGDVLESQEVTLGQKAEGYDEVLGGLSEGDVVVTSGNFLVDSESKLRGASK